MIKYVIFPVSLHEYQIEDKSINQRLIPLLEKENFLNNGAENMHPMMRCWQTDHYLHEKEIYSDLISFFKKSLKEYVEELKIDCEELGISICWGNKYPKNTASQQIPHVHRMSYISGVYHLTDGAPIYFNDPVIPRTINALQPSDSMPRTAIVPIKEGRLILFPSWLEHGTLPHQDVTNRWSIAFNTIPIGKINIKSNISGNPSCILKLG